MFADDFVGISDSKESLQKLLDVVYSYCSKWRLRANVSKSAVMVFSKDACVEECISERERKFEEGLNTKVKLDMYKRLVRA